jgi:hypothetical protein
MVAICRQELMATDVVQPHLQLLARSVQNLPIATHHKPMARRALANLIQVTFSARSGFFHEAAAISQLGRQHGNTYIEALVSVAVNYPAWRRTPGTWKVRSKNTRRQFESLLRHLFCEYSMPRFFDSVWFLGDDKRAKQQQRWYLHVGAGGSIRDCDLPIKYTRRMGHYFMLAPSDITVADAIRWGQFKTLGFTDRQIRALLQVNHVNNYEHEPFWLTVFHWLAAHPCVNDVEYGPLIDFLHNQRFVDERQVFGRDESLGPPQPNLTMKRRDPHTLLKQMHAWHRQLANDNTQLEAHWRRSGFPEFEHIEGQGKTMQIWTIRELLSREALVIEGRKLNHCVASYVHRCASGGGSIWTMELENIAGRKKLLTIELQNSSGRIVQARGRANRRPRQQEISVLRRWAASAGLTVGVS